MTPLVAFVLGLLIGWLVEWVIDWLYWRRKNQRLQAELDASRVQTIAVQPSYPDDLEVINGIGPVIAKRLNENGIYTFEQLAEQTPISLREILGDTVQRLANEESLIEQAHQLALRKQPRGGAVGNEPAGQIPKL